MPLKILLDKQRQSSAALKPHLDIYRIADEDDMAKRSDQLLIDSGSSYLKKTKRERPLLLASLPERTIFNRDYDFRTSTYHSTLLHNLVVGVDVHHPHPGEKAKLVIGEWGLRSTR